MNWWTMVENEARSASERVFTLGEGPFWDPIRENLHWVDITAGSVFRGRLELDGSIRIEAERSIDSTVGAVAVDASGRLLIAGADRLFVWAGDVIRPITDALASEGSRLNDGKPDPAGRFIVGTLRTNGGSDRERLVSVDIDGTTRVIDDDLQLSNGLVWSEDSRTMYSVDTGRGVVYRRSYDPATGETGARSVALRVDYGSPDGMTIDAEGCLWIAIWGAGEVRRYSPSGELQQIVSVPAPHVTSVAFAGPTLDTLVITTATQDLSPSDQRAHPLSGRLFTTKPGVQGIPQPLWSGVTIRANDREETR